MADRLLVTPYARDLTVVSLLDERGVCLPDRAGRPASVELLESILAREGWQYRSRLVTGAWEAHFVAYGGRRPPIREVSLGADGTLDFGASPLYGSWHVSQEVARNCGPQVAVESGGRAICLVTEATPYEEFHQTMAGRAVPEDRSDLQWDGASQREERPHTTRLAGLLPTPEEALEVALAGGSGHEQAATQVGRALQAYRWSGPQSPPLSLDAARHRAVLERLRRYVRDTPVPAADLVWALGQADGTRDDLAALLARLQPGDGPGDGAADPAAETMAMARVFVR